ncbi:hypothetical protein BKA64DRAFT_347385 [Cadophora sp. MPI-SDFR-AT-0126]|nr:hypothetical protein BKA64DRAFT_347385 [Leotiomycetes sp. MPI-SDFR-AT-0126]
MSTLPTTRTLLTSLFNTLTTTTQISAQEQPAKPPVVIEPYDSPSNPLKSLSSSHRAVLSTLHVLFTPPMLLQALDLLDRGLVVRVVEQSSESTDENKVQTLIQARGNDRSRELVSGGDAATTTETEIEPEKEVFPPQVNIHLPSSPPLLQPDSNFQSHQQPSSPTTGDQSIPEIMPRITLHQVRSSQPPKSRFRDATSSTSNSSSNIYTVSLKAWNCSCAAFAFASFPASTVYPSKSPWDLGLSLEGDGDGDGDGEDVTLGGLAGDGEHRGKEVERGGSRGDGGGEEEQWEFGGMSRDGRGMGGGNVPCCKHLLACVLGERWDILRGYVKERVVSRVEMAGLGCE